MSLKERVEALRAEKRAKQEKKRLEEEERKLRAELHPSKMQKAGKAALWIAKTVKEELSYEEPKRKKKR